MLKGELLANRLYELFGPVSIDTSGIDDNDLNHGLHKRGVATNGNFEDSVRLIKLNAGERAEMPVAQDYRFWAFYCSEHAAVSRKELDAFCIGHDLERAPLSTAAAPYGSLDKVEPWWAIYQRRPGDTGGFLSSASEGALDQMGRYAQAADSVRPGDRVLILGNDGDGKRFISDITAAREVVAGGSVELVGADLFEVVIDVEETAHGSVSAIASLMRPAGMLVTTRKHFWDDVALDDSSAVRQRTSIPRGIYQTEGDVEITSLRKPYLVSESKFHDYADTLGSAPGRGMDFSRYYVFPHVIRAIVNKQHRCADTEHLRDECRGLLQNVAMSSADAGAALCVLAYASPGLRFSVEDRRVDEYLKVSSANPHVIRWQISLAYVRGEAFMSSGDFEAALAAFETCLSFPADAFHPSILTKQVGACLKIAHIAAALGETQKAAEHLQQGALLGRKVCGADPDTVFGSTEDPRFFYFGELAEVLTLSSRCAYAYEHWRRTGADGLRTALAGSTDLFRSPRASDIRDFALQKEIIDRLQQSTDSVPLEHRSVQMSMIGRLRLVIGVLTTKMASKFKDRLAH